VKTGNIFKLLHINKKSQNQKNRSGTGLLRIPIKKKMRHGYYDLKRALVPWKVSTIIQIHLRPINT
jgi:hypothetical protein